MGTSFVVRGTAGANCTVTVTAFDSSGVNWPAAASDGRQRRQLVRDLERQRGVELQAAGSANQRDGL
ncbi:MAG: hypothetical protein R2854_17860 [Caldilineaceae bacterium]